MHLKENYSSTENYLLGFQAILTEENQLTKAKHFGDIGIDCKFYYHKQKLIIIDNTGN